MSDTGDFLREARDIYVRVIRKTLEWMLARPTLHAAFLNTKQNSITLQDYDAGDGWRAPDILYGWIQGRGLEALMRHAQFFEREAPELSKPLFAVAEPLYRALASLWARDGHAYFTYNVDLAPIIPGSDGKPSPRSPAGDLFSYSDIFVAKGLLIASMKFDPASTSKYLSDLASIVEAVEQGRFMIDEKRDFALGAPATDAEEYGPRMILMSASALLRDLGFEHEASFSNRFVARIVERHLERSAAARAYGLLRDRAGRDRCNPGHAIEFVGFALECHAARNNRELLRNLSLIVKSSFHAGFREPGLVLGLSAATLAPESDLCPWWSLPEAMRTAALLYRETREPEALEIWRRTHEAFFRFYWRDDASLAYQMRNAVGPVDHAPATPDLDPGYHTGLSFLSTIGAIDGLLAERAD
ncbi:AGE family epimerase/isomerase [Terrarubrum flagellatum]|uniref:AGE family epimerase/isomerase n=1 Tax=Terrirubrum flagellatum TaxID=2895980 RepID=UPI00314534A6